MAFINSHHNGSQNPTNALLPSKRKAPQAEEEQEERPFVIPKVELKHIVDKYVQKYQNAFSQTIIEYSQDSPYPDVPGLPNAYNVFNLHQGGLPDWKRKRALSAAQTYHATQKSNFMGYQANQALDYDADFHTYLDMHVNNIGDPFTEGNFTVNSKFMERAVLEYYAALWHAQWPHSDNAPDSYWGFCLTMGSTEGNLYGMWNARDYLGGKKILINDKATKIVTRKGVRGAPAVSTQISVPRLAYHAAPTPKDNPNAYTPIAFFSEDTHYSITKATAVLQIRTFYAEGTQTYPGECPIAASGGEWPAEVPSYESGAMDMDALALLVEFFASRGYPIFMCFNYGTTFKGAYDDVALACTKLEPILKKYNLFEREVHYDEDDPTKFEVRSGYWFHVDGALGAAYMPYIEMAYEGGHLNQRGPNFDFRLPMVHSIAMSGHKWPGATVPCGIYMTKTRYQMLPPDNPIYIGSPDTTFAGSRNGLSPMLLWDNIARHSFEDQIEKALRLERLAVYTEECLRCLEKRLGTDLYVARTPLALTVRFKQANEELCHKYSLSNEELEVKNESTGEVEDRHYSHVFMMEHVTKELVDALVEDLSKEGAFRIDDIEGPLLVAIPAAATAPASNRLGLLPGRGRGWRG